MPRYSACTDAGIYEPLLLTDDAGVRLAYAWQVVLPGQRTALLDYFAVRCDLRGGGVGTQALQLVKAYDAMRVHDLLLECARTPPRPLTLPWRGGASGFTCGRGRGPRHWKAGCLARGDAGLSLPCGGTVPDAALCKELRALYKTMIPQPYYRGNVIILRQLSPYYPQKEVWTVKLDPKQYDEMVNRASPPSPVVRDCVWAFCVGGAICTLGEGAAPAVFDLVRQNAGRHPDEHCADFPRRRFHAAGLVSETGRQGGRGYAGAYHRVCQLGRQPGD